MAITLPTFTISDPVKEDRLLNAFKPTPTSTKAEAAAEYERWLRRSLIAEVVRRERDKATLAAMQGMDEPTDLLT